MLEGPRMARVAPQFVCRECGAAHRKWAGQCGDCGAWNAIEEDAGLSAAGPAARTLGQARGRVVALGTLAGDEAPPARGLSGLGELDRVLGGGLVPGSAVLVGGDPGIGKSTLLLQATAAFAGQGANTVYVSGEEAPAQIRMRAGRLGLAQAPVRLAAETNLRNVLTTLDAERPDLVVIDSIQTMWADNVDSAPGSVSQVRACAHELVTFAKRRGVAVVLVGHVTKDGQIAGPRVVEHMVDTVLYFEGERSHRFRILRAVKNRFGPADEIGVFEMTGAGLAEVLNPSALFLGERGEGSARRRRLRRHRGHAARAGRVPGAGRALGARHAAPRGHRLGQRAARHGAGRARRALRRRLSRGQDVYLNVAGGLRIADPAADLAAAAALVSALKGEALPADTVIFGEISLSGAIGRSPSPRPGCARRRNSAFRARSCRRR